MGQRIATLNCQEGVFCVILLEKMRFELKKQQACDVCHFLIMLYPSIKHIAHLNRERQSFEVPSPEKPKIRRENIIVILL